MDLSFMNSYPQVQQIIDPTEFLHRTDCTLKVYNEYMYFGQLRDEMKMGLGILKSLKSQEFYVGGWRNDEKYGIGFHLMADGGTYFGNYKQNQANGHGQYTLANKVRYQGYWKQGLKHGYGDYQTPEFTYQGQWVLGEYSGTGLLTQYKKFIYNGQFVQSAKHGSGVEMYPNGDCYRGAFCNNIIEGYGEFYYANGNTYMGSFVNGLKHGKGIMKIQQKDHSFDIYDGNFFNDRKNGFGKLIYADGDIYEGYFVNDVRQGYGEHTRKGVLVYKGQWIQGKKVDKPWYPPIQSILEQEENSSCSEQNYNQMPKIIQSECQSNTRRRSVTFRIKIKNNITSDNKRTSRKIDPLPLSTFKKLSQSCQRPINLKDSLYNHHRAQTQIKMKSPLSQKYSPKLILKPTILRSV